MQKYLLVLLMLVSVGTYSYDVYDNEAISSVSLSKTTITRQEARWFYTLKSRYWVDGQKITIYHLPFDHPVHKEFVKEVLEMQPSQFVKSVQVNINSGNAAHIREVKNLDEMFLNISEKNNSLGYISKDYMIVNGGGNVNILKIID